MATTKKTTTKKTTAKKVVAEQLEEVIPTKPEPVKPKEEEKVSYVIPKDPGLASNDQYFEWCCNGINYRFKRGELLTHPRSLYEAIYEKLFSREHISPFIAEFKNTSKKLN